MHTLRQIIVYSCFLIVGLSSCYEKQEGCLDIIASNFDYGADLACASCCTYPKLRILIEHAMDTVAFKTGIPFELENDQVVRIEEIIYLWSEVQLLDQNHSAFTIEETVELTDHDQNDLVITLPDNFLRITYPKFNFPVGTFRHTGMYDSIQFVVGIDGKIELSEEESGHPLAQDGDSLFVQTDHEFISVRLVIQTDTSMEKLDTFLLQGPSESMILTLPVSVDFQGGEDLKVDVKADYKKWFEGVHFQEQSHAEVKALLRVNFANVFSTF